jgi:hypothetical protein
MGRKEQVNREQLGGKIGLAIKFIRTARQNVETFQNDTQVN